MSDILIQWKIQIMDIYDIYSLPTYIMLRKLNRILAKPLLRVIRIYQYTLSPDKWLPSLWLKGKICAHEPHCSEYSMAVLKRYGFRPWIFYAMDRVLHCTPSMHKKYDPDHYRVVFFSSAPIGVPFLKALVEDTRFDVVGIVTQCDKPAGRWMEMCENIIKQSGKKLIENWKLIIDKCIVTPTKLNPEKSEEGHVFAERLKEKKPDLLVVIAYGKIIPQAILDIPKIAPINVHGSILPKYRGASPIQSTVLYDEKETGMTIMRMDATMDTGNIIDMIKFSIPFERTTKELIEEMKKIGPKFLNDTLRKYGKGLLGEIVQQENQATYCTKIEKDSWLIDPRTESIETIYNKYRAFSLRPKIHFLLNEKRVIIEEMKLSEPIYNSNDASPLFHGKELNKAVLDIKLKPEGKKAMGRKEFLNGYLK